MRTTNINIYINHNCCIFDKFRCLFECFVCQSGVSVFWWGFRILGGVVLFDGLYFYVKVVDVFCMISFDDIKFLFNFYLMFELFYFNFSANYIVESHLFNMVFK